MHYRIMGEITAEDTQLDCFNAMINDEDDTILIELSSLGGSLDALMLFLTRLHEVKEAGKKVVTFASGPACSAAATLLWQGDEVYVSPTSLIMYHDSCESITRGPLTMLWITAIDAWKAFKTGKKDNFSTFSDKIFDRYEPWDLILKAYKESKINGDYYFDAHEFAALAPEKVKVGLPPYKLALFGEEPSDLVSLSEVLDEVREMREDAADDCDDEDEEEDEKK